MIRSRNILALTVFLLSAPAFAGTAVVQNNSNAGTGSLREAVGFANSGVCANPCTITFGTFFSTPQTILLAASGIVVSASNVTIDGFSGGTTGILNTGAFGAPDTSFQHVIINGPSNTCCSAFDVQVNANNFKLSGVVIQNVMVGVNVSAPGAVISGSKFGTNNTGTALVGPSISTAIRVTGGVTGVTIGGVAPQDRNLISGSSVSGVDLQSSGTLLTGNYIGVNAAGNAAFPNGKGVTVSGSSAQIGNTTLGNVISGNSQYGVEMTGSTGTQLHRNKIGLSADGLTAVPNTAGGISVGGNASSETIGGAGSGNLIAGNGGPGILIGPLDTLTVEGNQVGGFGLANAGDGIRVTAVTANAIKLVSNTIQSNSQNGVVVDGTLIGVEITQNNILSNNLLGIDLRNTSIALGATLNDTGDADTGAGNNLQNFPVITSAQVSGGTLAATVNVDSSSVFLTASLRVELFEADTDLTNPEGARYLGGSCFPTKNILNGTITVPASGLVTGDRIVSTATSFSGTSCFAANVTDGTSEFSAAVAVVIVNSPPVANPDSLLISEDTPGTVDVRSNDTDAETPTTSLTVTGNTNGSQGTVTCTTAGACTYTPNPNTNGTDTFTYTLSDGSLTSTGTVTVTITAVNDPPIANPDSLTTNEDTAGTVNVLANDTDVDTPPTTLAVVGNTNGSKGTVTCTAAGVCTYTPAANATGADSFTYSMSDGPSVSTATVTVTITAVNDAPVANADSLTTNEDTPGTVNVLTNDTDVDGPSPLSITGSTNGTKGAVLCNAAGSCTYTPNLNATGTDSFTYNVTDGTATSIGTVNVTITPVNDAPVANPDSLTTNEDTAGTVNVLSNDTDADVPSTLTVTSSTNGTKGSVSCTSAGSCTYTPTLNATGTDSFTYSVSDGTATSTGTVTVTITAVNDAPVANADSLVTNEDTPGTVNVLTNDTDVDGPSPLSITGSTNGTKGAVLCNTTGSCTYTPNLNATGTDSFTYNVFDGTSTSIGTVNVNITPINDAPVANPDSLTTNEDTAGTVNVLSNDTDPDTTSALTVTGSTNGTKGAVSCTAAGVCTYTPNLNANGTDTFTYTVSDGIASSTGVVNVTITPVNDPPVANPDTASTVAGTPVTKNVIANDTDADGDPLAFSGSTNGANGAVLCTGTNCTYTPAPGFTGTDSFTYTITDGAGGNATTTVTVTVASLNAAPNATDDSASTLEGRPVGINVLANDSDPNGDPLTITSFTQGTKGTVSCASFCTYQPNSGQSGADSFTYTISDGKGGTATATVKISIRACPDTVLLFSPQDGATNVPTSGNLSYASGSSNHIVYFGPAGSGCTTAYRSTINVQVPYSNLLPGTEYEWRVEAEEPGCRTLTTSCARFRTARSCPAAPTPLQPAANAVVQSPVTFSWTAVTGASNYRVFVSANGGPASEVGATTTTTLTAVVADGPIRWFVVATVSGCGDLQSATVSNNVCNVPGQPLAGVVGESTSEQTYSVSWLDVAGATRYEVQEATNAAFTDVQTFPTPSTSVSFTKSATNARPFFYRVRAFSDCFGAFGPFSPVIRVVIVPVPPREDPDTDATVPVGSRRTVVLQVFVAGEPNQTLRYSATGDKPWMRVDPANGSLPPEGVTLNVSANPADLPNGTFTGTVIVTISDTSGARQSTHATTSKQVPVSINLVTPVLPIGSGTPPDSSLIIPAVGHLDGLDARWRSDVRIANTSGAKLRYQVSLVPADVNIGQKQTTIDIDAGATTALDDVVRAWYGVGSLGESSAGYLEIRPLSGQRGIGSPSVDADPPGISLATVVTSRTYSQTSAGTLGEFIPGIAFGNFIGRTAGNASPQVLNLQQIAQDSNFRTNVGLVEASGNAATALVSIYNSTGTKLRDVPVELRANEQRQLNSLLAQQNITLADGRIEVRVTGGEGKVTAYAAVVDNRSKDQLFVPPVELTNLLSSKYVVAGVADLTSGNAIWRSDLRIFNAGSAVQNATLTLYPQNNSGAPVTANISINPGAVSILDNIVRDLFRTSNLGGAVHVDTPSGSSLVVTGRTYTPTANGILGQFIEATTPDEAVGSNERSLNILQAEDSVRYRTNLGLAEVTGKAAVVEVTISLPDSKVSPVVQIPLAANEFTQLGILRGLGIGNIYNARLSIRVVSGEGRVTAYGSLIDMKTQDSTYVPAR